MSSEFQFLVASIRRQVWCVSILHLSITFHLSLMLITLMKLTDTKSKKSSVRPSPAMSEGTLKLSIYRISFFTLFCCFQFPWKALRWRSISWRWRSLIEILYYHTYTCPHWHFKQLCSHQANLGIRSIVQLNIIKPSRFWNETLKSNFWSSKNECWTWAPSVFQTYCFILFYFQRA